MNLASFSIKLKSYGVNYPRYYEEYNDFWKWKIEVEATGKGHILDNSHLAATSSKLLDILPGWQTYRGVECDYRTWLPVSLRYIADAYDQIRKYSLLYFGKIPDGPLEYIWHELGRVKTVNGNRREAGDYSVISVCKPLMFIWGQTPPFDSRNRRNMHIFPYRTSWEFKSWKEELGNLITKRVLGKTNVIDYCRNKAKEIYKSEYIVPYGRFLDIYYF